MAAGCSEWTAALARNGSRLTFAWNLPSLSDFVTERTQIHRRRGSEVDLMTALYPLSVQLQLDQVSTT